MSYLPVHESPSGPGDARPTSLQIIQDENLQDKLTGKVILITGCSSGIGIETARALFTTGATLYLTVRDLVKGKIALAELLISDRVHLLELDLNSLKNVRECASKFLSISSVLNIFIANAGVMQCPEGRTADNFETQFGTNHLAHYLLFNLLKPALLASSLPKLNSRAIFLTSCAHRFSEVNFENLNADNAYDAGIAYAQSKTANIWTATEIERRYGSQGLHAWAVHPGAVQTSITQHLEPGQVEYFMTAFEKILKNPEQGAATTVWAATAQNLEGKGGGYLEECQMSRLWVEENGPFGFGHASWAMDGEKAGKLWETSAELVGLI